ncbi:hypothetical protein FSP39_011098 [Pinctada imbricata]|uniref:folate gamma-glutamyl hydrolase n=1 Tax=Pinctada imbricata TaxID=66713 RepID=A0AA88XRA3_PINIB|nr:hypothetical protein FSP39_011098 [Pinctada imbricata]
MGRGGTFLQMFNMGVRRNQLVQMFNMGERMNPITSVQHLVEEELYFKCSTWGRGILAQELSFPSDDLPGETFIPPSYLRHLETLGDTYIPANYVKWLESAGARVVPIRIKEPLEYYQKLFNSINGVLFPGGGVDILTSEFAKAAKIIYKLSLEANDKGDYFPLWGTCQGFELLTALTTGQNLLASADAENLPLPLDFSKGYRHSRLFADVPKDIHNILSTQNVTPNFHQFTLTPTNYSKSADLKQFYRVLSTNKDRKGLEFISTFEAYKYPIYGIQWHPEKNNYAWNPQYNVDHTADGIKVSQYFAEFFVSEARKSSHQFPSMEEEIDALIDNFNPIFSKNHMFLENYYFNYTNTYLYYN